MSRKMPHMRYLFFLIILDIKTEYNSRHHCTLIPRFMLIPLFLLILMTTEPIIAPSDSEPSIVRHLGLAIRFNYNHVDKYPYSCEGSKLTLGYHDSAQARFADIYVDREPTQIELQELSDLLCHRDYTTMINHMAQLCTFRDVQCNLNWNALTERLPAPSDQATYWHETDMEPDDLMAIFLLPIPSYVVVGEGDARVRLSRAENYYYLLSETSSAHEISLDSKKPVFINGSGSSRHFPNDGHEFSHLVLTSSNESYKDRFREFARTIEPVMISMKPMRELFDWYIHNPEEVRNLLREVTLYTYGGFNFRSLLYSGIDAAHVDPIRTGELLVELLSSFKNTVIYESYHATSHMRKGEDNTINAQNSPNLQTFLRESKHPYIRHMNQFTTLWNEYILKKAREDISERVLDPETRVRREKIITQIDKNRDFQYVLADMALAVLIHSDYRPELVQDLHFEGSYTHLTPSKTGFGTIWYYRNIDPDMLREFLTRRLYIKERYLSVISPSQ